MRRELALGGLAALLLLTGCGGDSDRESTGTPSPSSEATSDDSAKDDGAKDVGANDLGDLVVVLAKELVLADVLAHGIEPVASTASVAEEGFQGLDDFDTSDIEVLPMTTLSLEHLASIQPTTIITLQFWADQVGEEKLTAIADLITIPDGLSNAERMTELGDLVGRPEQAAAVVADLAAATEEAAAVVPDDCAVSIVAIYPGPSPAVFVTGPWEVPVSVLATGCALDPDPTVAAPDENGRVYLSLEQLGILDAPKILLLQAPSVEGEQAAIEEIEANPLWAGLPAVQADDVVVFDRLGYPGAVGQIRFLGEFAALFE